MNHRELFDVSDLEGIGVVDEFEYFPITGAIE